MERYTRPAMGRIWSEAAKYQAWLRVEIAVCEAYARRGQIPAGVMTRIRALRVVVDRILAIQQKVKHEMIALLTSLEEQLGDDSRFVHIGLTTSDVWDTATALQLRHAIDLLMQGQDRLRPTRGRLARGDRAGGPRAAAHGGAGGAGAVRRGAEGLQRDAAQAQPGAGRAHLRPGPPAARERDGGARERRPVARARHQPLVGRARRPAGLDDRAGLHSGPRRVHRGGPRGGPGPHGGEPRALVRAHLLPARAAEADRRRARPSEGVRDRPAELDAGLARAAPVPRAARRRSRRHRAPAAGRAEGVLRSVLVPAKRQRRLSPGGARVSPRRAPVKHEEATVNVEQRGKLYEGKAKIVYATSDRNLVVQYFKDDATAFNALKKGTIVGKGVVNNRMSATLFRRLAKAGVPTHYVGTLSDREMLCRRLDIIKIETIVRNVVAGSLAKRTGLEEGTPITQPIVELYLKSDALGDPMINEDHVRMLGLATPAELPWMNRPPLSINALLRPPSLKPDLIPFAFNLKSVRGP